MKHILVLVDMTKTAEQAVSQALSIAAAKKARITICHIRTNKSTDTEDDIHHQLEPYVAQAKAKGVPCELCICQGDLFEEAAASVKRLQPDLTVAGTHGSAGIDLSNFGSAIHKLVRKVSVPTLVIGKACTPVDLGFRKVLITADGQPTFLPGIQKACDLLTDSGEIIMFAIVPKEGGLKPEILQNIEAAKEILDARNISWHYEEVKSAPYAVGYAAQTLEYILEHEVEMVIIPAEVSKPNFLFGKLDKEAMLLNEDGIQVLCVNSQ